MSELPVIPGMVYAQYIVPLLHRKKKKKKLFYFSLSSRSLSFRVPLCFCFFYVVAVSFSLRSPRPCSFCLLHLSPVCFFFFFYVNFFWACYDLKLSPLLLACSCLRVFFPADNSFSCIFPYGQAEARGICKVGRERERERDMEVEKCPSPSPSHAHTYKARARKMYWGKKEKSRARLKCGV